jgi:hypothetical protein
LVLHDFSFTAEPLPEIPATSSLNVLVGSSGGWAAPANGRENTDTMLAVGWITRAVASAASAAWACFFNSVQIAASTIEAVAVAYFMYLSKKAIIFSGCRPK